MTFNRKRILAPAAIVLALALTPALTACGGNPIQGIINNATGGQVDIGGTSVPKDFPAEVPLVSGEVITGAGFGTEDGKVWNVAIKVSDVSVVDSITEQLTSAGFEKIGDSVTADEGTSSIFTKEPFAVMVIVAKSDDAGVVANYTVTFSKEDS